MARRARRRSDTGWYHVMNRGVDRTDIYRDDRDRIEFGGALAEACERTDVEVHAYALMGNHFHLLLRDRADQVSTFMHLLGTTHGRRFNDRHGRDGPLFRSRFHSVVVATDVQLLRTLRYVHLNPVGVITMDRLESFRWSSHRTYLGYRRAPDWLVVDRLLGHFDGVDGYRDFVHGETPTLGIEVGCSDVEVAVAVARADVDLASGSVAGVIRDVGLVLAERHPAATHALVDHHAATASAAALRSARTRARRRRRDDPTFALLVDKVELMLQLGPVPSCNGQVARSSPARSWAA